MEVLKKWRGNLTEGGERVKLAAALKELELGKLAAKVEGIGK